MLEVKKLAEQNKLNVLDNNQILKYGRKRFGNMDQVDKAESFKMSPEQCNEYSTSRLQVTTHK